MNLDLSLDLILKLPRKVQVQPNGAVDFLVCSAVRVGYRFLLYFSNQASFHIGFPHPISSQRGTSLGEEPDSPHNGVLLPLCTLVERRSVPELDYRTDIWT